MNRISHTNLKQSQEPIRQEEKLDSLSYHLDYTEWQMVEHPSIHHYTSITLSITTKEHRLHQSLDQHLQNEFLSMHKHRKIQVLQNDYQSKKGTIHQALNPTHTDHSLHDEPSSTYNYIQLHTISNNQSFNKRTSNVV